MALFWSNMRPSLSSSLTKARKEYHARPKTTVPVSRKVDPRAAERAEKHKERAHLRAVDSFRALNASSSGWISLQELFDTCPALGVECRTAKAWFERLDNSKEEEDATQNTNNNKTHKKVRVDDIVRLKLQEDREEEEKCAAAGKLVPGFHKLQGLGTSQEARDLWAKGLRSSGALSLERGKYEKRLEGALAEGGEGTTDFQEFEFWGSDKQRALERRIKKRDRYEVELLSLDADADGLVSLQDVLRGSNRVESLNDESFACAQEVFRKLSAAAVRQHNQQQHNQHNSQQEHKHEEEDDCGGGGGKRGGGGKGGIHEQKVSVFEFADAMLALTMGVESGSSGGGGGGHETQAEAMARFNSTLRFLSSNDLATASKVYGKRERDELNPKVVSPTTAKGFNFASDALATARAEPDSGYTPKQLPEAAYHHTTSLEELNDYHVNHAR